jgi:hypothetical protein
MFNLGFVARMADWLRGHQEPESSPFDRGDLPAEAPPQAEQHIERIALLHDFEPEAPPQAVRFEPAARSQAVMQELMVRFTGATDALAGIRGGLAGLEKTFQELPEVVKAQTRFLGLIADRLERHEVHLQNLAATLRELPESTLAQMRAIEKTNRLLEESHERIGPLTGGFHRLANTMQGLNESSERHLMCLGLLTERHERYLREQREGFRRHNRLVIAILAATGALGIGGIILALVALLT